MTVQIPTKLNRSHKPPLSKKPRYGGCSGSHVR